MFRTPRERRIENTNEHLSVIGASRRNFINGFYFPFDGLIDDVRVYNRAITHAEINELSSNRTCTASPNGLVNWWTGDGHATDLIGNNNGTLIDASVDTICKNVVSGNKTPS